MRFFSARMLIAVVAVLSLPVPAFAASTIMLSAAGDGVYQLQGVAIENAAAMDVTFSYDAAALANPRFAAGPLISGAMTAFNPNVPGTVRIAIIRTAPMAGSGIIATISFDRTGSGQGKITSLVAKLSNVSGSSLAALVQINNETEKTSGGIADAASTGTANVASTVAPVPAKPAALPSTGVIMAGQPGKPEEAGPVSKASGTVEHDEPPLIQEPINGPGMITRETESAVLSRAQSTARINDTEKYEQESVLDRFKAYRGERSAGALIALFNNENMNGYRQEPPVALSDGKSSVKSVFLAAPGEILPDDIKTIGARLVSVRKDPGNTNRWILTFIPEKGKYRATFTIIREKTKTAYPLTIAPKITLPAFGGGPLSEAGFNRYLKAGKTLKAKKYDLNKDGKYDYIDDYLVTANYLAAIKKAPKAGH